MAAQLLAAAAQRPLDQLGEKLYFEVFADPARASVVKVRARVGR